MYILVVAPQPLGQLVDRKGPRAAQRLEERPARRRQGLREPREARECEHAQAAHRPPLRAAVPRRLEAIERIRGGAGPGLGERAWPARPPPPPPPARSRGATCPSAWTP